MEKNEMIAEYLSRGYKAAQVASFCECSEAYISALYKTEPFKEILKAKFVDNQDERIGNRYNDLEEATIKALKSNVEMADVSDLTRILESVTRVKNAQKHVPADSLRNPTLGITLVFNQNNQPRLVTDDYNRIVAIGDNTMVAMPAKAVRDMFNKMSETEEVKVIDGTVKAETNTNTPVSAISQIINREYDYSTITKADLAA